MSNKSKLLVSKKSSRIKLFSKTLAIYVSVPIVANACTVTFMDFLDFFLPDSPFGIIDAQLQSSGYALIARILPFPVVALFVHMYLIPILQYTLQKEPSIELRNKAQKHLLNAPLINNIFSVIGWILAVLVLIGYTIVTNIANEGFVVYILTTNILLSGLCFVIGYYMLEFLTRRFLIYEFFPSNNLLDTKGVITLSMRARFLIFFYAICFLPIHLFYKISSSYIEIYKPDYQNLFLIVPIILLLIGMLLTFLIARSYTRPINKMMQATYSIQNGEYDHPITIQSTDEIANLSHAMNQMSQELKEKELIKETFGKAVDPAVRDHLLKGDLKLGGELKTITILFSDIRGFTALSENLSPEKVVFLLNQYFERMSQCIGLEKGLVNKYIGDAVLAIFGAPLDLHNHADAALKAGLLMRDARDELNIEFEKQGLPKLNTGIGIHTGQVLAGNIGSSQRLEYTVIGDAVNLASRIEGLCKKLDHDLIISEDTKRALTRDYPLQSVGRVKVKGREQPVPVYYI